MKIGGNSEDSLQLFDFHLKVPLSANKKLLYTFALLFIFIFPFSSSHSCVLSRLRFSFLFPPLIHSLLIGSIVEDLRLLYLLVGRMNFFPCCSMIIRKVEIYQKKLLARHFNTLNLLQANRMIWRKIMKFIEFLIALIRKISQINCDDPIFAFFCQSPRHFFFLISISNFIFSMNIFRLSCEQVYEEKCSNHKFIPSFP